MYKMLINLIKLFQSAAETSNFKQACKRNGSKMEKKSSESVPHHYCTRPFSTIAHLRNRPFR